MKKILFLFVFGFVLQTVQAQLRYTNDTLVYLSKVDSAVYIYIYPVFTLAQAPKHADMLNAYVKNNLMPDASVFEKLQKIDAAQAAAITNKEKQLISMLVAYKNDLIICLQTNINVDIPGNLYEVGDMYFETLSIASGNKYEIKNLFTKNVYDTLYARYTEMLDKAGITKDHLIEQIVGFGLIKEENTICIDCFVLEVILKEFYADAGPMLFELKMEDVKNCINADGPLKELRKN